MSINEQIGTNAIGIYVNSTRDDNYAVTLRIVNFIQERGKEALICGDVAAMKNLSFITMARISDVDCLLTLGGDGTLLRAVKTAAQTRTPVLGINLGRLGYLTDAGKEDCCEALGRLIDGQYTLERRVMLVAEVGGQVFNALNDAYITRGGALKLLTYRVEVNTCHMDTYQADGVLVATPTGSTAYSLSAGGPVIKPGAGVLAITSVCPHALHARSAIVADSDHVSVTPVTHEGALYMDGERVASVPCGMPVAIRKADTSAVIVRTSGVPFYDVLRRKLNWE